MNRAIASLAFFFLSATLSAQGPLFGLFGDHYSQTAANGDLHRVNKRLAIVYSPDYCQIFTPNGDIISFRTRNYTKTLDAARHSIHESFLNDDSRTTRAGFYTVMIDRLDDQTIFQIASPAGTMIVQHAQAFSENGRVPPIKVDWAAVRASQRWDDSLRTAANRYRDSLANQLERRRVVVHEGESATYLKQKLDQWIADSVYGAKHP